MLVQEAWFPPCPRPRQWKCTWLRSQSAPRSPELWEPTALQSPGWRGIAERSPGLSLQFWFDMWGWSWGQHLSPTEKKTTEDVKESNIVALWFLWQVEFFIFCQKDKHHNVLELVVISLGLCWAGTSGMPVVVKFKVQLGVHILFFLL